MDLFIADYLATLGGLVYLLIAIAIFLEGEAVIFGVMFLAYQGSLNFYAAVAVIILSVLLTDIVSYNIGYYGPKIFPRVARFYERIVHPMDTKLRTLSFVTFLISKFTYGFHRAVLIRSGMLRLPFWKFFRINVLTAAIWIATIAAIAFASWKSLTYIQKSLHYVEVGLIAGVVLVLIGSHLVAHLSKRKLLTGGDTPSHHV
ncbi:MAG: hypothetical protein A2848_01885 [Candidatus Magasanikbacteria bacterium RIFCSPHIGHO2_01_FULL_50_8]|uniref:DedA family protein n=2 Tax=Candidatus Magasanikiibacteriota TaxID=1752731 RepID=A0A1F6LNJ0_9BACT|nr:MAG: hypothetical protein A2848_01885 [Candidatus Magasanikbacteria bacterium RIFCSPHIGHO2_01_FULL_50_8]OGH67424.1 MAG: hypothetical protein A3C15_00040 [Candidatus Magasanikbacteria bacterium RIFCSPHIGHO2_02_FULL_50_9b]